MPPRSPSRPHLFVAVTAACALTATLMAPNAAAGTAPSTSVGAIASVPWAATADEDPSQRTIQERRRIGKSVKGRPIYAYRLGEGPGKKRRTVALISTMHGNEPDTRAILTSFRDGDPVRGIDLWIVPTYNPDGLARGTRRNARGVDLNRNYPERWKDLDGNYESGPGPASEPETKAMMRFLRNVKPQRILSFHQPLNGVDVDTKRPRFAKRVARALKLPRKTFSCGGRCHGTMTMWFNANFFGNALTVEYGSRPSLRYLRQTVPNQVLGLFGARFAERQDVLVGADDFSG